MRPPKALWVRLSAALLIVWLVACRAPERPDPDLEPVFDLVARFAAAEWASEVPAITFAVPAERRLLISGWSRFEHDTRLERGFAWGLGGESAVDLFLIAPRDLELGFEVRPLRFRGAPQQAVTVQVNGEVIGEVELRPELAAYTVSVPAAVLRGGTNALKLAYRWSRSPRELGLSDDPRQLAAAWYEIRFGSGQNHQPLAQDRRLFLPFGSRLDFFVEVPPRSELRAQRLSVRGSVRGALEISQELEDESEVSLAEIEDSMGTLAVPLEGDSRRLLRLSLRAVPRLDGSREIEIAEPPAGFMLEYPALWAPLPSAPLPSASAVEPLIGAAGPPREPPNIVLYVIDTLRADHLGCYGYPRPVSPSIDAFSREAVLFEHAVAQSSWTRSSMASISSPVCGPSLTGPTDVRTA